MSSQKEYSRGYFHKKNFKKTFSKGENFFLSLSKKYSILSPYYHQLFQCLEKVPNGGTLLDVGIANGTFAHFVHMIRPDIIITGLDITDVKELIPSYVNFVQGDASQFSLPGKFDMIMCNHLLEHMPVEKVPDVLSSINKHLTSTGVFWFTVPSLFHGFYNDPTHIRPYTKEAIKRLLPIADFSYTKKVIKEGYYFRYPIRFLKFPHFRITYGYIQKGV